MSKVKEKAVANHRRRMKRLGLVRVELKVRKEDVPLLRSVASALADPSRAGETRALLRDRFSAPGPKGLKALLAAAPLEGIDLARPRDMGREL